MYVGHGRLCVCLSLAALPHYCMDPDEVAAVVGGAIYTVVVHYWADSQSVHGFRCYDNIAPNECECLYTRSMPGYMYLR